MTTSETLDLCIDYPLFVDTNFLDCFEPAVGPGWIQLIKEMLDELRAMTHGYSEQPQFNDIREKWGKLDVLVHAGNDQIFQLFEKYTTISEHVCAECGSYGDRPMKGRNAIRPLCRGCGNYD